jgi:hypothetical protein
MTKTKVVDLKKLYDFLIDNFFIWNHLYMENTFVLFTFEIWIWQTASDG